MPAEDTTPQLAELEDVPFVDEEGQITSAFEEQVGVYAIFNRQKVLQFIGYSRNVSLSLRQHLVRQPEACYWVKVQTIARPSKAILEQIRDRWIAENGEVPPGNAADEALWSQPIDAKASMTAEEKATYAAGDDLTKTKTLKQVARRVEAEVLAAIATRGVKMSFRFDPKLKEEGLLNLK